MQCTRMLIVLALFWLNAALSSALAQGINKKFFLLEDLEHNQWCIYNNESEWNDNVRSMTALTVGTLDYSDDQISKISLTEEDEAGDWIVYDHYRLNDTQIREVQRTINILPED